MTRAPLFRTEVRVRLNAPGSRYHEATGTVDAIELELVHGKDKALTLNFDDGNHTIAFGDELVPVDSTPRGTPSDKSQSRAPEGSA